MDGPKELLVQSELLPTVYPEVNAYVIRFEVSLKLTSPKLPLHTINRVFLDLLHFELIIFLYIFLEPNL